MDLSEFISVHGSYAFTGGFSRDNSVNYFLFATRYKTSFNFFVSLFSITQCSVQEFLFFLFSPCQWYVMHLFCLISIF